MNFNKLIGTAKRALIFTAHCVMLFSASFAVIVNAQESSLDSTGTVHIVEIKEFKFVPADINVEVGDTVKWVNLDFVPHTATAQDESWDSGFLAGDAVWEMSVTKDSAGNYICAYHPMMKGSISIVD